ncbi:MAG: IS1096 element passenger TnpR family protein [Egibacteraceae bacterium]
MTIRVVLTGREDVPLVQPPGRVLLVHADHTFADLAEAIDTTFGRWDLAPLHEFAVEGRQLGAEPQPFASVEDSDAVTVGEVGLRPGSRFNYLFDLEARWIHICTVEGLGVDPYELAGGEPELPTPIFGWGTIPDQYGRHAEDEGIRNGELGQQLDEFGFGDLDEELDAELAAWDEAETASWDVVAAALSGIERPLPTAELAGATARLRAQATDPDWPYDILFAAAAVSPSQLPADDQRLWLELASSVVSPRDETPLDVEAEAAWLTLELADWAGAIIGLVRGGTGHPAEPDNLVQLIEACPEIDPDETDLEDEEVVAQGFETVVVLWEALGAIDSRHRLTALGRWGLPEALRVAWTG